MSVQLTASTIAVEYKNEMRLTLTRETNHLFTEVFCSSCETYIPMTSITECRVVCPHCDKIVRPEKLACFNSPNNGRILSRLNDSDDWEVVVGKQKYGLRPNGSETFADAVQGIRQGLWEVGYAKEDEDEANEKEEEKTVV